MLDVISIVVLGFMFAVGFAYVRGCDGLRGRHS